MLGLQLSTGSPCNGGSTREDDIPNLQEVKALETAAVKLAEGEEMKEALTVLNQVITLSPKYPSAYNNRAQVRGREESERGIWGESEERDMGRE